MKALILVAAAMLWGCADSPSITASCPMSAPGPASCVSLMIVGNPTVTPTVTATIPLGAGGLPLTANAVSPSALPPRVSVGAVAGS